MPADANAWIGLVIVSPAAEGPLGAAAAPGAARHVGRGRATPPRAGGPLSEGRGARTTNRRRPVGAVPAGAARGIESVGKQSTRRPPPMASHTLAPFPDELLAAKKQIRERARSY